LKKSDLGQRFLLEISYEQKSIGFNTSRSRIVTFEREDAVLRMLDMSGTQGSDPTRVLATIPISGETRSTLDIDLNAGFDTVSREEDRTGEDYYGRIDSHDANAFRLFERKPVSLSYHEATLVFDQEARTEEASASSFTTI